MIEAKTFWFGCQSNSKIGLGHVSRCVALAEEIEARGHVSCFAHLSNLDNRGLQLLSLSDLKSECNCNSQPDVMIYDSYDLDFIQSKNGFDGAKVILLVDDISLPLSADAYLEASTIKNWKPLNGRAAVFKFDCNPILRSEFDIPLHSLNFSPPFDVIINLGAARDFQLILNYLIPQIRSSTYFNQRITILKGSNSVFEIVVDNGDSNLNLVEGTHSLRELISPNTFIISGSGVTAWELISLGVPGFLIGVVDNQIEQLEYFNKLGLRHGIFFQDNSDFSNQLNNLLEKLDFVETAMKAQESLKNGRVESVNWILREVLNLPNHLT